jgi:hypothetical protein
MVGTHVSEIVQSNSLPKVLVKLSLPQLILIFPLSFVYLIKSEFLNVVSVNQSNSVLTPYKLDRIVV